MRTCTAQMRAFLERLAFPWLSNNDYSMAAPKKMPVILVETMNGKHSMPVGKWPKGND